jgi:hypothetical protein
MRVLSIIYRPFCGLLFLLMMALSMTGCESASRQAFAAELSVDRSEVKPGESIKISATLTHPPNDLRIKWAAAPGQLNPQADSQETTYTAPQGLSRDQDITVKIRVEFFQGDKFIDKKDVSVIIKKEEIGQKQSVPDSTIPATSLPITQSDGAEPKIEITQIPPYHPGGPVEMFKIAGKVSGVPPEGYRVVLYAYTDVWWIQPFSTGELRFTEIQSDGSFSTQTHGGMIYAALLVRDSFTDPPIKTDNLPRKGKDVVAIHRVEGSK